jgi:Zn-dependent protease with chaperone function
LTPFIEFIEFYWSRTAIVSGVLIVALILASLFAAFRLSKNSKNRSGILLASMCVSSSFWIFVLASFAFCMMLANMYWDLPVLAVKISAISALAASAVIAPIGLFALRGRAAREISFLFFNSKVANLQDGSAMQGSSSQVSKAYGRVFAMFSSLCANIVAPATEVEVVTTCNTCSAIEPFSAAFDWNGNRIVAITEGLAESLEDDELEAVLAHEIAHIKSRDALQKTAATAYRMAFPFDPLSRFIEAALYRERELAADEFAANATSKPAALASALLKIYELGRSQLHLRSPVFSALSIRQGNSGILSKQPPLRRRIKRLLDLSEKGETKG